MKHDPSLADRIAYYLAGTGRALSADEIARELGEPKASVVWELLTNDRFALRLSRETLVQEGLVRYNVLRP